MDAHGRSWTVMDAHGRSWTLGGRDGHVGWTRWSRWVDAGWTRRSRWVDATVTLDGRDGHATVTVTLPNHKNHCIYNLIHVSDLINRTFVVQFLENKILLYLRRNFVFSYKFSLIELNSVFCD